MLNGSMRFNIYIKFSPPIGGLTTRGTRGSAQYLSCSNALLWAKTSDIIPEIFSSHFSNLGITTLSILPLLSSLWLLFSLPLVFLQLLIFFLPDVLSFDIALLDILYFAIHHPIYRNLSFLALSTITIPG